LARDAHERSPTPHNPRHHIRSLCGPPHKISQAASEGTTVYDGDRLSTAAGGSLRLLIGEAMLYVTEQSNLIVHQDTNLAAKEFEAKLVSDAAVISVTAGTTRDIVASSARIRPIAEMRGVVQVRLVGPHELMVFARRGPAQISYRGESETIAEGKSYRVLLNPSDDSGSGVQGAKKTGKHSKALVLIAVGVAAAARITALWRGGGKVRVGVRAWRVPTGLERGLKSQEAGISTSKTFGVISRGVTLLRPHTFTAVL
jgi:hypothetical protein